MPPHRHTQPRPQPCKPNSLPLPSTTTPQLKLPSRIDPPTRLLRAIHLRSANLVSRLLTTHPHLLTHPDYTNRSNSPLHLASSLGCLEIVTLLLKLGHEQTVGETSRNADHETPLMLASRNGHVAVGELLVTDRPSCVSLTNRAGLDALAICAATPAAVALMPTLLQAGASPHARDFDGNTPLHHASASGSLKALRLLLSVGANPLAKNLADWTPLAYSQTVAAEVYFKNLVAEFERVKIEGTRERVAVGEGREVGRMGMGERTATGTGVGMTRMGMGERTGTGMTVGKRGGGGVRLVEAGDGDDEEGNSPGDIVRGKGSLDEEGMSKRAGRTWSPVAERRRAGT